MYLKMLPTLRAALSVIGSKLSNCVLFQFIVVPVHRCSSSSSLAQGSLEQGRAAPARLARKEWAEKVGLELKLPSLPLGIGQLGRLSEAKTQSAKAA
jgi:hypothetical protein